MKQFFQRKSKRMVLISLVMILLPMSYCLKVFLEKPPKVILTIPFNGSKEVDPKRSEIIICFDQPMLKAYSCVKTDKSFPKCTTAPYWKNEHTFIMPVKLHPNQDYGFEINSKREQNFQNQKEINCKSIMFEFQTTESKN